MISEESDAVCLTLPATVDPAEHQDFRKLCTLFNEVEVDPEVVLDHAYWTSRAGIHDLYDRPLLDAAAHVLIDLVDQGWAVHTEESQVFVLPPGEQTNREDEKARVRKQEHLRRDAQLRQSSVRRFVRKMESPRERRGELVSIFNVMRDGEELADSLERDAGSGEGIQPYVQVVDTTTYCEYTGLRLHDVWRYFRHTWANAYSTVPGRSMPILIRDAATKHHAVIGLAAISSPIVQIAERDKWIRWDTKQFVRELATHPSEEVARWLKARIQTQLDEVYVDDLLRDGVVDPVELAQPNPDTISRLRADAERHRLKHHQGGRLRQIRRIESASWVYRAETDLFRSKRASLLAETLEIRSGLEPYLRDKEPAIGLRSALEDSKSRKQIGRLVRRARGERVGTVIADLTVCGAVAPYNELAAGKLVGALAVSPTVLAAYKDKYERPSEIASAMAGRPIIRENRLAFVGTTSLYGSGSSQYNRLFWPASLMGGPDQERLGYQRLGRSLSFGTSHFSPETVTALVRAAELTQGRVRVNSLFGEGVSPRLRKVRLGLAALGWPANELLRHGRERILYGVPLVRNLRDYSLGLDPEPDYLMNLDDPGTEQKIAQWWLNRWASRRIQQEHVRASMRQSTLTRPVQHGARVALPNDTD